MKQVAVLGCGAWATAISRLIAENVVKSSEFLNTVSMYVYNEKVDGENLDDIINRLHINPLYLSGFKLPENVVASLDLGEVVSKADILAIAYPAKLIPWLMDRVQKFVGPSAYFITFCKGLVVDHDANSLRLISDIIREKTGRPCVCVIGATTASEVAWQHLTEATIGSNDQLWAEQTKRLLMTDYFRLTIVKDPVGVELCGALKNVIAIAAGIADGLGLGDNTRAAILRLGFWEMVELMKELFPGRGVEATTIAQSCGIAELFVCMSHRSDEPLALGSDVDLMNIYLGRSLATGRRASVDSPNDSQKQIYSCSVNGAEYAEMIYKILKERNQVSSYPLFTSVHLIIQKKLSASDLLNRLRDHPVHAHMPE